MAVCLISDKPWQVIHRFSISRCPFGTALLQWSFVIRWGVCNGRMVITMMGHHQRTDGAPHTPSPVRVHVHMQVNPKRGRCEFRPTFGGYTGTLGGVINNKREDGVSVDSNEVARHAHGKRFTGARPESEPVASLTIECYEEEPAAGNWARFTRGGRLAADRFRSPGFARVIAEGTASMCRCRQVTSVPFVFRSRVKTGRLRSQARNGKRQRLARSRCDRLFSRWNSIHHRGPP